MEPPARGGRKGTFTHSLGKWLALSEWEAVGVGQCKALSTKLWTRALAFLRHFPIIAKLNSYYNPGRYLFLQIEKLRLKNHDLTKVTQKART